MLSLSREVSLVVLMIVSIQASSDHPSLVRAHWPNALVATVTLVTRRGDPPMSATAGGDEGVVMTCVALAMVTVGAPGARRRSTSQRRMGMVLTVAVEGWRTLRNGSMVAKVL
jgi:hypothetical protein